MSEGKAAQSLSTNCTKVVMLPVTIFNVHLFWITHMYNYLSNI